VDALEALGDHGLDAQQHGALGRPVARGAGAVFLAAEHDQRRAFGLVAHRRVVDRHSRRRVVLGHAAFGAGQHLVLDADIGEGAAHHDFVVAAARAVAVEVLLQHLVLAEIFAGGAGFLDVAGGADVVGGDVVAEHGQDARAFDVADRRRLHRDALEIGRVLHVGGAVGSSDRSRCRLDLDRLPLLGPLNTSP
jgi:hypothetical protein